MSGEEERKKFGEDIAFGVQQTAACWATDFIDPWVGEKIQARFEDERHHMPTGSTWIGEIVGDSAAFFAFLSIQKFVPGVTRTLHAAARKMFGPLLERSGKRELREWADKENISPKSPEYKAKMEEWKEFQSDNIAKSAIISSTSIALNIGTQKAIGNTHKIMVIALAKIAGATITVAGMLGLRFAIPRTTRTLDKELSHRYFTPLIRKTQKIFGAEVDEKSPEHKHAKDHKREEHTSHVQFIEQSRGSDSQMQYSR